MLKKSVVCVLIAMAAAVAWLRIDDVPVTVELGTKLSWGDTLLWGMFPIYGEGNGRTYVFSCNPAAESDSMWDTLAAPMLGGRLEYTGLAFQWKEQPVLWAIGYHPGDDTSKIFWYDVDSSWGSWRQDTIPFELGDGASVAYDPNRAYWATNFAVPGWLYCLPGGNTNAFWRYAIPGGWYVPPVEFTGFYPDSGGIISDPTPQLAWGSTGAFQYRVQVSTTPYFVSNVIDSVVTDPEYVSPTELDNGIYYWRTASWAGGQWVWCSAVHSFDLQGGWQSLAQFPREAGSGAIIAYDSGSFSEYSRSILAFAGGTSERVFYRYDIAQNTWIQLDSLPASLHAAPGTSLTTRTPAGQGTPSIYAVLGGEAKDDNPWQYLPKNNQNERWQPYDNDDTSDSLLYYSHLPRAIWPHSSMVLGGTTLYLIPDKDCDPNIYEMVITGGGEGGEASVSHIGGATAHAIAGCNSVEVEYQLPAPAHVRATLHDAVGRQVGYLDIGEQERGAHRLNWDRDNEGHRLGAGAYFVLLDMGTAQARLKAVVK